MRKWKQESDRKVLMLRGPRQVGKTYAARQLGKTFERFVEINLEERPDLHEIFDLNLVPDRIVRELTLKLGTPIVPGETLLFIDEIQSAPKAILALRYFYEKMPELHVIAAGSLLDFAIEEVGMPVGRVESLYVYPLSFAEFLAALGKNILLDEILRHELNEEMPEAVHKQALRFIGEYIALGGMPKIVNCWKNTKDPDRCSKELSTIIINYRQDFNSYAREKQIKYVEQVFKEIPRQQGTRFRFSEIEGDYRKRELAPALELLHTAGIAHLIYYCSGFLQPSGASIDPLDYKVIFLDVGLAQSLLTYNLDQWFINPLAEFATKGPMTEAFVGQEMLAYDVPYKKSQLLFWHRKERGSTAEIDYILEHKEQIIPVEVKGGATGRLKSMHEFLNSHPGSKYGVRFSAHNYSISETLRSYPLYAIVKFKTDAHDELRYAVHSLLEED